MTNIRTSGFDSPAQLREHMAELEYDRDDGATSLRQADLQRQISELQIEMRELRKRVVAARASARKAPGEQRDDSFWPRLATTVAATLVMTAAIRYFRLGPAGTAAIPLIASKISRGER